MQQISSIICFAVGAYGPCVKQRNDIRLDDNKGSGLWEEELLQGNKPSAKCYEGENIEETSESRAALSDLLELGNGVAYQSKNDF